MNAVIKSSYFYSHSKEDEATQCTPPAARRNRSGTFIEVSHKFLEAKVQKEKETTHFHRFRVENKKLPEETNPAHDFVDLKPTTKSSSSTSSGASLFMQCTAQVSNGGKLKLFKKEIHGIPLSASKMPVETTVNPDAYNGEGVMDRKNFTFCQWDSCGAIVPRDWSKYKEHLTKVHVPGLYVAGEGLLPTHGRGMTLYGIGRKPITCLWHEGETICQHQGLPSSLSRHMQAKHLSDSALEPCPKCGKKLANRSLYQHMRNPSACQFDSNFIDMHARQLSKMLKKKLLKKGKNPR